MQTNLGKFLIELATKPHLHDQLNEELLITHGITNSDEQNALLNKDADALKELLGGASAMLNNNGTVYTLSGDIRGYFEGDEIIIDKKPSYDITLKNNDKPEEKEKRAYFESGRLKVEPSTQESEE